MTIFKPKRKNYLNKIVFALGSLLVISLAGLLYLENLKVSLSHDIKSLSSSIRDLKVENSELKNDLFSFFTPEAVAKTAEARGLVKENNPVFVYAGN